MVNGKSLRRQTDHGTDVKVAIRIQVLGVLLQFGGERVDGRILPRDLSTHALDKMKWTPVVKVNVPDHIASPQMCEVNKIHQILQAVSVKKAG